MSKNTELFYVKKAKNIEKSLNGKYYRVRKMVNGQLYRSTFTKLRDAKKFLASL